MQPIDLLSSLSKDVIDMDAVLETIRDNHVHGFQTLHDIQATKMDIRHIDIPLKDFKVATKVAKETTSISYPTRYAYQTDIDLVESEQELLFKKNENVYNSLLSLKDISEERRYFKNNIIPILDNKIIYNLNIVVTEDNCTLVFVLDDKPKDPNSKGISKTQFLNYVANDEVLHILVVPNYHMEILKVYRSDLQATGYVPNYEFSKFNDVVPGSTFTMLSMDDVSISNLTFIRTTIDDRGVNVPGNILSNIKLNTLIMVTISFDDLYHIDTITSNNEWFILDNSFELPLPKRNILPFVLTDNKFILDDSVTVDLYYPNIYHVNNVGDRKIQLFEFYRDDTIDSRYKNALQSLRLVYDDVLELYKSESLPDIIKDFIPVEVPMISEPLFKETIYYPNEKNAFIVNHVNKYFNEDPDILVHYLYLKLKNTTKFFVDVSKLDLSKRKRMNTVSDIGVVGDIKYFDVPHYVLNIRKTFVGSPETQFKLFIDKLAVGADDMFVTYNKDYFLIYVKSSLVKNDSMIEIERFVQHTNDIRSLGIVQPVDINKTYSKQFYDISKVILGLNVEPIKVKYTNNLESITAYNIDILDEKGRFLDNSEYKLVIFNDVVDKMIVLDNDGNYIIDRDFYVIPDDSLIGSDLRINFNTGYFTSTDTINKNTSVFSKSIYTHRQTHQEDVRVFKNGLNLPIERIRIRENNSCDEPIEVVLASELLTNDRIDVDTCPFAFKEEFRLDLIDNDKGYIDTGNALSYPLDLKWYDIYLNGYRLSKKDIDIISSNRFFVKNVDSLKNLRIMKRLDINGVFSTQHDKDVENIIIDNMEDFLKKLAEDKDIIQDTAKDIIGDAISDIFEHMEFVEKYLEFIFINPNEKQLTQAMKLEYPELFDEYDILTLSTESKDVNYITSIDSNIRRKYMKQKQYRYGFTPLYVGNHEDAKLGEYMCDPITGSPAMKTNDGSVIASGMLSRLSMHKDRLNNQLMINNFTSVSIYHLDRNSNLLTQSYNANDNMIDEDVDINASFKKMMISFDMDVLERGEADIMHVSNYDPNIKMIYSTTDEGEDVELVQKLSEFNNNVITVNSDDMTIKSISIQEDPSAPSTIKYILYSILLAF